LTFSKADGPAKPKEINENALASGSRSSRESKPGRKKDMKLYYQAIKLHKEGKSQVEIAKEVGRDKSTICKRIKEHEAKTMYDTSLVGDVG
jgi:predicted DNA-binding protein